MNIHQAVLTSAALLLSIPLAGCAVEAGGDGPTAAAASPLVTDNALIPNALIPNALIPNALIPNALIPNALIPNALSPSALAAIQDPGSAGDLSRQFLSYAVGCALDPTQSFSFTWSDASGTHTETYPGLLGIAPGWASGALDSTSQQLLSGCLAARVNWYGTPVMISVRSSYGSLKPASHDTELTSYPHVEGAFWGNLFAATPSIYACFNAANVQNSRTDLRDCAAGHVDAVTGLTVPCGAIVLAGDCSSRCDALNGAKQYYPSCTASGGTATTAVITTALP